MAGEFFEGGVVALLSASADLVELIGDRFDWMERPDDLRAGPFLVLTPAGEGLAYSFDGASRAEKVRVQVDAYAADLLTARRVAFAARKSVEGARGAFGGVRFHGAQQVAVRPGRESLGDGSPDLYRISADFKISWSRGAA